MKITRNHKGGFNYEFESGAVILQCNALDNDGILFDHGIGWDVSGTTEILHALRTNSSLPRKCFPALNKSNNEPKETT